MSKQIGELMSRRQAQAGRRAGETGNWPAAVKVVSEWFPPRQCALTSGVYESGAAVGPLMAPPLVAWRVPGWGWPLARSTTIPRIQYPMFEQAYFAPGSKDKREWAFCHLRHDRFNPRETRGTRWTSVQRSLR